MHIPKSQYTTETTAHAAKNVKKVILNKEQIPSLLQAAIGELKKSQIIETHSHETMNEFFYLINGKLHFEINSESFSVEAGDSILVKKTKLHSLLAVEDSTFLYFGLEDNT